MESSCEITNPFDPLKKLLVNYKVKGELETINDKIYISPFLNEVINDNPFKQRSRTYPIDMVYAKRRVYVTEINIPEGYELDYTPKIQKISNSSFDIDYVAYQNGQKISVHFYYHFKKPVYKASEYSRIKLYYNWITDASNEKIVLRKKDMAQPDSNSSEQ